MLIFCQLCDGLKTLQASRLTKITDIRPLTQMSCSAGSASVPAKPCNFDYSGLQFSSRDGTFVVYHAHLAWLSLTAMAPDRLESSHCDANVTVWSKPLSTESLL